MTGKEPPKKLKNKEERTHKKVTVNLFRSLIILIYVIFIPCVGLMLYGIFGQHISFNTTANSEVKYEASQNKKKPEDIDKIENGIHVQTGLIYAEGFQEVRATCTACHSAKLVTQNRATREGWESMIDWMQETQGLWELGAIEPIILDYLSKHYAPQKSNRRKNLDLKEIEWYILELE